MRSGAVALVALVAAVGGGLAALALGNVSGLDGGGSTTVYVQTSSATSTTAASSTGKPLPGNGFDPAAIYASRAPGVVTIYSDLGQAGTAQGSGFVVDGTGSILTNAHVITNVGESAQVRGADHVFVEFRDGERVPARIVGWDVFNDIGAIRVDPHSHALAPVPLGDSRAVVVGQPVAAIGSPFGNQSSLAVGVVSATGRAIDSLTSEYAVADAIQIDAPINKGNSGGPLFDARGRVIGINAQIRSDTGNAEGVGFAIPINIARRALDQLLRTGHVVYAYIGVKTEDVTPGMARRFGLAARRGALIVSVDPDTPASRAGLRGGSRTAGYNGLDVTLGGDEIVKIGSHAVRSSEDVSRVVSAELMPGQTVPFVIVRGGRTQTVDVILVERPPVPGSG